METFSQNTSVAKEIQKRRLMTAGTVVATIVAIYYLGKSRGEVNVFVAEKSDGRPAHTVNKK